MNAILLLIALSLGGQLADDDITPDPPREFPVVEQSVELVSVVHVVSDSGSAGRTVFFFSHVQNEWMQLDHRWLDDTFVVVWDGKEWVLTWLDNTYNDDACYRVVRTPIWVEGWHEENPIFAGNGKPWFVGLLEPGLKSPPKRR